MKRVLNSGTISLVSKLGEEDTFLDRYLELYNDRDEATKSTLNSVVFFFDIKAPIFVLQTFHKANLGTLETAEVVYPKEGEVYLPPFFYKLDRTGFVQFDGAKCNELFTKYSNFYRNVFNFYHKLLEQGVCQQEAALVLPMGLFTTFRWQVNGHELMTFIENHKRTSPEMCGYAEVLMLYLQENMPRSAAWILQK